MLRSSVRPCEVVIGQVTVASVPFVPPDTHAVTSWEVMLYPLGSQSAQLNA